MQQMGKKWLCELGLIIKNNRYRIIDIDNSDHNLGHKSLNTVKLLMFADSNIEINSISTIGKLVPTFVSGKVYLSKRPNLILNE